MTESRAVKYFHGIIMRAESDLYEFVVHGTVTDPDDGIKHTYIAKMAVEKSQQIYDILNEFAPTRIYIHHEVHDEHGIIDKMREQFKDKAVIKKYNEGVIDKTNIVRTARMLFLTMEKEKKFMQPSTTTKELEKFVKHIRTLPNIRHGIKEDKNHRWVDIDGTKIPILKDESYPRMLLCWALSFLAASDDDEGWSEQVEFNDDEWKKHRTS